MRRRILSCVVMVSIAPLQDLSTMLTFEDCLGLCELSEEEIDAIAEHEHITEMAALEMGHYLVQTADGVRMIKKMILDDIATAEAHNNRERLLCLKAALKHFVDTHPDNPRTRARD
jgi:hypothetical protein